MAVTGETRCRVIVVAGAKGTPGCSFVAAGLASRLAAGGLPVLLVDADGEASGAAVRLGVTKSDGARSLTRALGLGGVHAFALEGSPVPAEPNLRFVEIPASVPVELDGRELVSAARPGYAAVVADLGHLHGPLQRQLAAAADWLLWVVWPDPLGLERADRMLASRPLFAASAGLVLNRLGRGCLGGAASVLVQRHGLALMASFRERRSGAPRGRRFQRQFGRLARTVHPDAAPAWRSWP